MMYWLTFPMFLAPICWSAGALYALTRLARRIDLPGGAVLAFSCYSLMMAAFPQSVIFHAYLLTGYLLWAFRRRRTVRGHRCGRQISGGSGGFWRCRNPAFGAEHSGYCRHGLALRPHCGRASFLTAALPTIDSIAALMRTFAVGTFPEIIANPVSPSFPLPYDGLSITPVILFLALFSLLRCRERRGAGGWRLPLLALLHLFIRSTHSACGTWALTYRAPSPGDAHVTVGHHVRLWRQRNGRAISVPDCRN